MFNSLSAGIGPASRVRRFGSWIDFLTVARLAVRTQLTRQQLPELSPHLLADIGVTRSAAMAEAARLPWDLAPRHYR